MELGAPKHMTGSKTLGSSIVVSFIATGVDALIERIRKLSKVV